MIILSKRDFLKNGIEEEHKDSERPQQLKPKLHFVIHSFIHSKDLFFFFLSACFVVNCCYSVTKTCLTLCTPMDYSMPGFPVLHYFLEFAQIHVHRVNDGHPIISSSVVPFSWSVFPSIRVFPISWIFASGGQSIGASASASVLPMNIQD